MSAWRATAVGVCVIALTLGSGSLSASTPRAPGSGCGQELAASVDQVIVRSCAFAFVGKPIVIRGYALGQGTLPGEHGVRRPPDVYMQISVSPYGAGPDLMQCVDRTDIVPAPIDPTALCFGRRSLTIARGTLLQCYVNIFNSADRKRSTRFGFSCSS